MSNNLNLLLPEYEELYNPNVISETDIASMDVEEIWNFNNCGEIFDTVEELLELLKGQGYDYDIDQILIKILFLKSKMHLTAIPI